MKIWVSAIKTEVLYRKLESLPSVSFIFSYYLYPCFDFCRRKFLCAVNLGGDCLAPWMENLILRRPNRKGWPRRAVDSVQVPPGRPPTENLSGWAAAAGQYINGLRLRLTVIVHESPAGDPAVGQLHRGPSLPLHQITPPQLGRVRATAHRRGRPRLFEGGLGKVHGEGTRKVSS